MEYVIQGRSPRKLYDFFEQISAIPRGSRNEKEISEYLLAFAAERGLRVWRDDIYNVIIWIPICSGLLLNPRGIRGWN